MTEPGPESALGSMSASAIPRAPANRVGARAVAYWTVKALLPVLIVAAIEVVILLPAAAPLAVWAPVAGISLLLAITYVAAMPRIRYHVHRWEQTPAAFYTRSGWVVVEQRIAPLSRVQTVDVERGLIENWFGLATVTVTTASAAGPLKVPALERAIADRVADELGHIAGTFRDDAT